MKKSSYNLHIISKQTIEERATELAQYIIDTKDTVRGAAKKFGISKSTVHKDVTFQNGKKIEQVIPERIEIKGDKQKNKSIKQ